jgi:Fe-S-cluster containining protein
MLKTFLEKIMNKLLLRYGELLHEVDTWFQECSRHYPSKIACHSGCSSCCRGLFDITLLDALYLKQGMDTLARPLRKRISRKADKRLEHISLQYSIFVEPWILNTIPEAEWDPLMPEEDETPCLLLDSAGRCLVYDHRPMTCRLNGIPLIDVSGEQLFDEWCSLNFTTGNPLLLDKLRYRFSELFAQELLLFQELTNRLVGTTLNEIDLFIPAAIVLDMNTALPVIRMLAGQSTATTKLPAKPFRS